MVTLNDDPPKTPPVVPHDYLHGPKVVDIGDLRIARGLTRRPASSCRHNQLVYDNKERRIWCKDCERDVEPFDAFQKTVEQFHYAAEAAQRIRDEVEAARKFSIRSIAAKKMDEHWRKRKMVPSCPHCHAGIWPEDVDIMDLVSKEWDRASRKKRRESKP